jgi:two-component system, OmpR family, sensor kinase
VEEHGLSSDQVRIESSQPVYVEGDADLLAVALRNLLDNALKHGGQNTQIHIDLAPGRLTVTDNGVGAVGQDLVQLVRPFQRGETAAPGSGLGLALVARIAKAHGARLELQSPAANGRGLRATLAWS